MEHVLGWRGTCIGLVQQVILGLVLLAGANSLSRQSSSLLVSSSRPLGQLEVNMIIDDLREPFPRAASRLSVAISHTLDPPLIRPYPPPRKVLHMYMPHPPQWDGM
jgi:hypothetical protein